MKKFNLLLTALTVLLLGSTVLNAQNKTNPWAVSIGMHAVDYTSVRGFGNEFFNYNNYSIVPPLSKVSIIRNLNRSFNLDLTASVGEVDNKRLRIDDELFINAGLGIRYNFANGYLLNENSWFDPYVRIGANYNRFNFTSLGDKVPYAYPVYITHEGHQTPEVKDLLYAEPETSKDHFAVSGGLGINIWFTKNFGLNVATDYNLIPGSNTDYFDFFQHTVGVTFRFGNKDRDGDGIEDKDDACPDTPGIPSTIEGCNGCPDRDGDGLCDDKDACPDEAGPIENDGCPIIILDRDGDGILDVEDDCPDTPGVASSIPGCNGCPDRDGDGVCDNLDQCPDEFGTVANHGCPEIADNCTDIQAIKEALKNVLFEYNSDKLTAESMETLNKIAPLLTSSKIKNPHWLIEGNTDNKGSQAYNLPLSEKRAASVKAYLETRGVPASIMKTIGFGMSLPITSNETADGRARNRRVEIKYADKNFQPSAIEVNDDCANVQIADLSKMIYFKTGTFTLVDASKGSLDVIAQYMIIVDEPFEVQGHTDDVGNDANNMTLSQKRAQTVVDYLIGKGVNGSKLKAVGYGEAQPKFDNKTVDGRAQNRRIEIIRLK